MIDSIQQPLQTETPIETSCKQLCITTCALGVTTILGIALLACTNADLVHASYLEKTVVEVIEVAFVVGISAVFIQYAIYTAASFRSRPPVYVEV